MNLLQYFTFKNISPLEAIMSRLESDNTRISPWFKNKLLHGHYVAIPYLQIKFIIIIIIIVIIYIYERRESPSSLSSRPTCMKYIYIYIVWFLTVIKSPELTPSDSLVLKEKGYICCRIYEVFRLRNILKVGKLEKKGKNHLWYKIVTSETHFVLTSALIYLLHIMKLQFSQNVQAYCQPSVNHRLNSCTRTT